MNKEKLQLFKSGKVLTIFIVSAVLIITALLVVLNFDKLKALILGDDYGKDGEYGYGSTVPEMNNANSSDVTDIYHTDDSDDIFSLINIRDTYRWELRITNSYNSVQTTDTLSLLKHGEKYAVDATSKKAVYSEGKLYIESGLYSLVTDSDADGILAEFGLTPLSEVIAVAALENSTVNLSSDGKRIVVYYAEDGFTKQSEYEVSVETGIVTYEAHYLNGQLTRSVVTDAVDVLIGEDINEEIFEIPTLQ